MKNSFNCISVDGDQSTSDTVLALSSQVTWIAYLPAEPCPRPPPLKLPTSSACARRPHTAVGQVVPFAEGDEKDFEAALLDVCTQLAEDIVRNGEGYVLPQRCQCCLLPLL